MERSEPKVSEQFGTLVSKAALRLVEISRTGCLLESVHRVKTGTTGRIRIGVAGRSLTESVRITRCQLREGGAGYYLGAEFLHTRRQRGNSLRFALLAMVGGQEKSMNGGNASKNGADR